MPLGCDCSECSKDECTGSRISSRTVHCAKLNPCSVPPTHFSPYMRERMCSLLCVCVSVCICASVGSLVYNFKVGLRQQQANGEHAARRRTHIKNVLAKSGQMYVSLLQLIMASSSTDLRALSPSLSLTLSLTHSVSPSLACFGLSFILLQPLWATLSHNVIIGPMMMACPQDKFFVIPHSSPHFPLCLSISPL